MSTYWKCFMCLHLEVLSGWSDDPPSRANHSPCRPLPHQRACKIKEINNQYQYRTRAKTENKNFVSIFFEISPIWRKGKQNNKTVTRFTASHFCLTTAWNAQKQDMYKFQLSQCKHHSTPHTHTATHTSSKCRSSRVVAVVAVVVGSK